MTTAADLHGPLLEQTGAFRGNALLLTGPARVGKLDVARAVAAQFKVTVEDVRTLVMRGKIKRVGMSIGKRSNFKKAFVTLKEGDKIELFEGGAV